jgi:hypothetical protein
MPYFNVSYTESNPYDNSPAWADGSTMSGIFFLNGISLGIDRLTTQYDNRFIAPGGQYVTWSAPFNLSTNRYAVYTNSYLQGISSQKRDGETGFYVVPFPICFQSSELTGSTVSDIQALRALFLKQQSIASPLDYATVFPTVSDPDAPFENILKCYGDTGINTYANEYLVTNTYGDYEYLAIWKNNLFIVLDFGWEASVGRTFHNNPQDSNLNNISTVGDNKMQLKACNVANSTYFSNEKYGYAQMSTNGTDFGYYRNVGSMVGTIDGKTKASLAFWLDSTTSQPDYQIIFHMVSSYDVLGSKTYRTFLKVTLDKSSGGLTIDFESQQGRGVDTITTSPTNIAAAPTFIQISIDLNKNEQGNNIIVYQDDKEHYAGDFTYNGGYDFQSVEYYFIGCGCTTTTEDPPLPVITDASLGIKLYSFYFWADEVINFQLASQNYWLTKQRYF